ncbi:hypothetical protein CYMTET_33137, partial [Cymbomonas tetramitiformis]
LFDQVREVKQGAVSFSHVKAHSNHRWNDLADALAERGDGGDRCAVGRFAQGLGFSDVSRRTDANSNLTNLQGYLGTDHPKNPDFRSHPPQVDGSKPREEIDSLHVRPDHHVYQSGYGRRWDIPSKQTMPWFGICLTSAQMGICVFCTEDSNDRLKPLTHSVFVAGFRKLAARAGRAHGDWVPESKLYHDMDSAQQLILPSAMATGAAAATRRLRDAGLSGLGWSRAGAELEFDSCLAAVQKLPCVTTAKSHIYDTWIDVRLRD